MTKKDKNNVRYHARFTFADEVWIARIDEIPEVHTFGRTLGKAREYLVDALALWLDASVENVRGMVNLDSAELPSEVQRVVDDAVAARTIAETSTEVAGRLMSFAALSLTKGTSISMRDAGELLGISHQRVQQLVAQGEIKLPTPKKRPKT